MNRRIPQSSHMLLIFACASFFFAWVGCGGDGTSPTPPLETVYMPSEITGPDSTETMKIEYYCCSGAACSEGHEIEHQFTWGDGDSTAWLPSTCASHGWSSPGSYGIKARARCKTHTDVVSGWYGPFQVEVVAPAESISQPVEPSGPLNSVIGQTEIYCTGGATSNMGHDIQYRFDWGDGYVSSWSADECASHVWGDTGSYTVKAQARCATHMHVISPWSDAIAVSIVDEWISPPNPPSGSVAICPDAYISYSAGGAVSSKAHALEYRFDWGDGTMSSWSANTRASHIWWVLDYFDIRAQARCALHPAVVSDWSEPVTIRTVETITTPGKPNGPTSVSIGSTVSICGGTATSSCGHYVEKQWRINGEEMDWTNISCIQIRFDTPGIYRIRVRGRCSIHTEAVSAWSITLLVTAE